MLIKLFKHEFKATARIFLPMYGLLIVFSVLTKFVNRFQNIDSLFTGILVVVPTILYACIIAGVVVMSIVMLIQRFSKNLLGDEGYLSHTLPVPVSYHILCKLATASIWVAASAAMVCLSSLYMAVDVKDWSGFIETFNGILASAGAMFNIPGKALFWGVLAIGVVYIVKMTLMIYAGLGIGQMAAKNKVGLSIIAIIGLQTVEQVLMAAALYLFGRDILRHGSDGETIRFFFWWFLGEAAVFGTVYSLVSNWMLKRRLNLA